MNGHDPEKLHIHNGLWPVSTGALRMVVYQPPLRITAKSLTPGTCLSGFQVVVVVGFLARSREPEKKSVRCIKSSLATIPNSSSRIRYAKDMNLEELFQSIVNQAGVKTIFGDPISTNGKTIVPVAKVRCGFGGGSKRRPEDTEREFGGGGGFIAKPVGVIEITNEETRFVPIPSNWPIVAAVAIGVCLGMLIGPKPVHVRVEKQREQTNP